MSFDDIPLIYQNEQQNIFYSMGYCGNSVSFSVQAGKRLAQKVAGLDTPNLPMHQNAQPKFPLEAFRCMGQWVIFNMARLCSR